MKFTQAGGHFMGIPVGSVTYDTDTNELVIVALPYVDQINITITFIKPEGDAGADDDTDRS